MNTNSRNSVNQNRNGANSSSNIFSNKMNSRRSEMNTTTTNTKVNQQATGTVNSGTYRVDENDVKAFREYLDNNNILSVRTRETYNGVILKLMDYSNWVVSSDVIDDYANMRLTTPNPRTGRPSSPQTVGRDTAAHKRFYQFLLDRHASGDTHYVLKGGIYWKASDYSDARHKAAKTVNTPEVITLGGPIDHNRPLQALIPEKASESNSNSGDVDQEEVIHSLNVLTQYMRAHGINDIESLLK